MTTSQTATNQTAATIRRPPPRRPYAAVRRHQADVAARFRLTHIVRTTSMGMQLHRPNEA